MAILTPSQYSLDSRRIANWTNIQEKTISAEYPLDVQAHAEDLEQYVARTYLQFLWLPESIMPLHLLVPSLRRVATSSSANHHPMHKFLSPLLSTTRSVSNKYHTELPQILAHGGGAGEMEETMMWFALMHEKADGINLAEDADGPWVDEDWRSTYLERMERREVQIQILLHLHKLCLPSPPPLDLESEPGTKTKTKKRKPKTKGQPEPILSLEEQLESFMDKLSMWQLVGSLDRAFLSKPANGSGQDRDDRDWIQVFVEDVVERQFKTQQPEICSLLRSKVFPSSPFSDNDTDIEEESQASTSRLPSPQPQALKRKLSRSASTTNTVPATSRAPSLSRTASATTNGTRTLERQRSRSLSVALSLAQEEEERQRVMDIPSKKRLNREVSMSRVFKPKPAPNAVGGAVTTKNKPEEDADEAKKRKAKEKERELGVTLVEETPVKPKLNPRQRAESMKAVAGMKLSQPLFTFGVKDIAQTPNKLATVGEEDDDDEEWMMDSSPDILLLNPSTKRAGSSVSGTKSRRSSAEVDEEEDKGRMGGLGTGHETPSRPSKKRRRK